jgi:WS/DGAT/MGAT family acyltransferase
MATDRERMSAVDAAWLRMDRQDNLMMIIGVWILGEPLAFERFRAVIAERFMQFGRFRFRPVDDLAGARWELDHDFDLDAHVTRVALPAPAGKEQLEALVSELAGTRLDARRPLWQFQLVENYAAGAAVVMRIHHCYADGIALTRVFEAMTDGSPEGPPPTPAGAPDAAPDPAPRRRSSPVGQIPGAALVQRAVSEGADWLGRLADMARHPDHAADLGRHVVGAGLEVLRVATLPDDPNVPLRGPLGTHKVAAWAEPLPLDEARAVARAMGCKINDVLMATVAGALGRYLREQGEETDGLVLRAAVPVNLREPDSAGRLGNQFGLVFLDLPVGIGDPLRRLQAVTESMAGLKGSYQPVLMLGMMGALGMLGEQAERLAVDLLSAKATLVASNVPGPGSTVRVGGSRIDQLMFWVPQSGGIGLGVGVLSYDGRVQFGLIADRKRLPDPSLLSAGFTREFEATVLAVLLGPWLQAARGPDG